jgi:hypothetical protein
MHKPSTYTDGKIAIRVFKYAAVSPSLPLSPHLVHKNRPNLSASSIELGLSILAANAPTLKPLFKTLLRGTASNSGTLSLDSMLLFRNIKALELDTYGSKNRALVARKR